jgi:hypothetical protein
MSQTSTQNTLLTASEGGIPPGVQHALHLVGADDQSKPSSNVDRDARISTVPISESPAVPLPVERSENPAWWPNLRRGMPDYREVERNGESTDRPLGKNTGEFVFLVFMLSGVGLVSVSRLIVRMYRMGCLSGSACVEMRSLIPLFLFSLYRHISLGPGKQAGNYVWRGTIGKMTDGIFKYQTGGQW